VDNVPKETTRRQYEPKPLDRSFILRLPDHYTTAIDGLIKKGAAKSRNELIVHIVGLFLEELRKEGEVKKDG
jgi:metal-responsive CopG/Arc/MetJ family transcriptional regulator